MPHELLEWEDIIKKTIYNPLGPIAAVFYAVEELLELSDITGTSYTKLQAVNTDYVILHMTGKFGLAIRECNRMPEIQKTWVLFKHFFWASHRELRDTSNITVENAGINHANKVHDVVTGIQEALQQYQAETETPAVVLAPVDHVANAVQNTQKQLATHLQQIQSMI